MMTFHGDRPSGQAQVIVEDDGQTRHLPVSRWKPTAEALFEWGYRGSGPANLAHSILDEIFGEGHPHDAEDFERTVVAELDKAGFVLTEDAVREWAEA